MNTLYSAVVFLCILSKHIQGELAKPTIRFPGVPILEYTHPILTCRTSFVKVPVNITSEEISYMWFMNGKRITKYINGNHYSPMVDRKQQGNVITCSASDVTGDISPTSSPYRFNIHYKPGKPVFKPHNDVYVLGNNCSNTVGPIVCSDDCKPPCSYQWDVNNILTRGAKFPMKTIRSFGRVKTQLSCTATNIHGHFKRSITIQFVPDAPRNFFCFESKEESVLLTGTSNKSLHFQVSPTITNSSFSSVSTDNLTLVRNSDTFEANISGLSPGINFLFRVYAVNPSGRSDPATTVCGTRSYTVHSTGTDAGSELGFVAGIGVGVAIVLVIVILFVITAVLCFKTTAAGRRKASDFKMNCFPPSVSRQYDVGNEPAETERRVPEGIETEESTTPVTHYESLGERPEPQTTPTYEKLKLYENQQFGKTDSIYVNNAML